MSGGRRGVRQHHRTCYRGSFLSLKRLSRGKFPTEKLPLGTLPRGEKVESVSQFGAKRYVNKSGYPMRQNTPVEKPVDKVENS